MKKHIKAIVSMLSLILVMSSCGGPSNNATTPEKTDSKTTETNKATKTELTIWVREQISKPIQEATDKFNDSNSDIHVTMTSYPDDEFANQLTLAIQAGKAPDIVSMDDILTPYFASTNSFLDISDKVNALSYKDSFSSGMVNLATYEGKIYAAPLAPDVSVLLYNKNHFSDAGITDKAPETWAELREYAKKLTTSDRYGYVYAGGSAGGLMFTFMPYVWGNGGNILDETGTKSLLGKPEAVEALQFFNELTNVDKTVPPSVTNYSWGEAQDAFLSQKASMVVLGSANVYSMIKENPGFEFGAALIPKNEGKSHSSFIGGDVIAITSKSKNVDQSWKFIEYMLSPDVQIEVLAKNGTLPSRTDLFDNEYFNANPQYDVLKNAVEVASAPYTLKYNEMYQPVLDSVQSCLTNAATAQEAFDNAATQIDQIMQ